MAAAWRGRDFNPRGLHGLLGLRALLPRPRALRSADQLYTLNMLDSGAGARRSLAGWPGTCANLWTETPAQQRLVSKSASAPSRASLAAGAEPRDSRRHALWPLNFLRKAVQIQTPRPVATSGFWASTPHTHGR